MYVKGRTFDLHIILDRPIVLDNDDDDDSNEDADDEFNNEGNNEHDSREGAYTAPQYLSLDARSLAPGEVQIHHHGLLTSAACYQALPTQPDAAYKDETEIEFGRLSSPNKLVIPIDVEYRLPAQFPLGSPTEEASVCIYQDGDNDYGCHELGRSALDASLDCVRRLRSSTLPTPRVRSTASQTPETATGGPDYVRRLSKEQQCQYAPLNPDARL